MAGIYRGSLEQAFGDQQDVADRAPRSDRISGAPGGRLRQEQVAARAR